MYNKVWIKQLFHDQRKQQNAGNNLRTCRTFKTNIKQEKIHTDDQKQRQILWKFRISSHKLKLKKEGIMKLNQKKRISKLCNVVVEDEMHFLFKCS